MFGVLFVLFVGIFGLMFVSILIGMFRTRSLSGKIFQLVEQQLDEQLSRPQNTTSGQASNLQCAHCGSAVTPSEKCPNCGANL